MDHSEQQHLLPDAAQLLAPDATKKPRTAVGLPSDSDRHYTLAELKACGFDAMAATIVHHIAYNTKRHKCAKAYTSSYWMQFFGGCSKKQARTAVKNALAATINDVPLLALSHGYFNGVWSPHYLHVVSSADMGTPHADMGTPCTEGNQQKETKVKKDLEDSPAQKTGSAKTSMIQQTKAGKDKSKAKPTPDAGVKPPKFSPKPGEVLHKTFRDLLHQQDLPVPELGSSLHLRDCASAEAIGYWLTKAEWDEQKFAKWITAVKVWHEFDELVQPLSEPNPVVQYPKISYLRAHLFEAFALYAQHLDIEQEKRKALQMKFATWSAEDASTKAAAPKKLSKIAQYVADEAAKKAAKQPAMLTMEPVMTAHTPDTSKPVTAPVSTPACHPLVQVVHVMTAEDYEPCDEPPDDYPKATPTQKELLAAIAVKQAAAKAAKHKATMFQQGKFKHAKTNAYA